MIIEITDEQMAKVKEEMAKAGDKGALGSEEDAGTWEAVGKWSGIRFVLDAFNIELD